MSNSDNMDLDLEDEFAEDAGVEKTSFKEMWENNPFLKIGAFALGAIVLGMVYMFVIVDRDKTADGDDSIIRMAPGAAGTVGEEVTEAYREAVEEENVRRAEVARRIGDSAMPTPIGQPQGQLEVGRVDDDDMSQIDPLQEWRRSAEARRFEISFGDDPRDLAPAPMPEITPMVEPIRPQTEVVMDPEMVSRLSEQMRMIIASKAPESASFQRFINIPSEYSELREKREKQKAEEEAMIRNLGGATSAAGSGVAAQGGRDDFYYDDEDIVLVSGGQVVYAQLLNELNSDIPTPVLAHILSGPLRGGRAIGAFTVADEYLVITFDRVIKDTISYPIDAIALDPDTTLGGMASSVDHHYFRRIILPAASRFISGYSEGVTQTQQTVVSDGGTAVASQDELDTKQEIFMGVKEAADGLTQIIDQNAMRPITVKLSRGTPMGLLFMENVRESDGQ